MKPTLEELVQRAAENDTFRRLLRDNPHLYEHLPDDAKDKLITALARAEANEDEIGVDSRVSKFDLGQGSWENTPFTG